jgi:hypothetical protein
MYETNDHVTLNLNNNMSVAAVILDIKKAFEITWHSGVLCKLSKLEFSTRLTIFISSFLSKRKFVVSVEGEVSTLREIRTGEPQDSVLSPSLYSRYINDAPKTPRVYIALFAYGTYLYTTTHHKDSFVAREIHRVLRSMETWCER